MAERFDVGERNPEFAYFRLDRAFVNNVYFGLDDILVIHRLLGTPIRAPIRGFATPVLGLRFKILAHVRWMREQAPPPARKPKKTPATPLSPSGGSS